MILRQSTYWVFAVAVSALAAYGLMALIWTIAGYQEGVLAPILGTLTFVGALALIATRNGTE